MLPVLTAIPILAWLGASPAFAQAIYSVPPPPVSIVPERMETKQNRTVAAAARPAPAPRAADVPPQQRKVRIIPLYRLPE